MELQYKLEGLEEVAAKFWQAAGEAKVFALEGEMGAGKTTLIEALCRQKGVKDTMGSPTFSIINEYRYREENIEKSIYHMDLYRLKDEAEVVQAGVEDCIYSGQVCFVEWPQKAPGLFDASAVYVHLEVVSEWERRLIIQLPG
jgi:tRNA threonylcarbamoyladenosine biosynthesis protein TsaE